MYEVCGQREYQRGENEENCSSAMYTPNASTKHSVVAIFVEREISDSRGDALDSPERLLFKFIVFRDIIIVWSNTVEL